MNTIDITLINTISKLKKQRYKKNLNKNIKCWHTKNKKDIDRLFSILLGVVDKNNIDLNSDLHEIYFNFIIFVYKNSEVSI